MHDRGAHFSVKSSEEAIGLVGQCRKMLDENTRDIQKLTGIHTTLNGPQGHVSARTVASVAMIDTGLQRLHANLKQFKYDQLGSVLSHEQAIMVPHSRECLVAVPGSCDETSSYRQHVSSRL